MAEVSKHYFSGSAENAFDDKGRLSIPTVYRSYLENGYYIIRTWNMQPYLLLYSLADRDLLHEKFALVPQSDVATREKITWLFARTHTGKLDNAGRILIPQPIRDNIGIGKQAVIVGASNQIEIWPKAEYDKRIAAIDQQATTGAPQFLEALRGYGL